MTMQSFDRTHAREIVALRLRAGMFGRPVLQLSRRLTGSVPMAGGERREEDIGRTAFHDVRAADMREVGMFLVKAEAARGQP